MTHTSHRRGDGRLAGGRPGRRDLRENLREGLRDSTLHDIDHRILSLRNLFRGGGGSVRRGNVRFAILAVLQEKPMHGYQVIQELESRTHGRWRPSAGSIYPTLQLLEDEGLVTSEEVDGRRTYTLTDAGRKAAGDTPLSRHLGLDADDADVAEEALDVRKLAMHLIGAAVQVKRMGSPEANKAAREILVDARKRMYRLLAEDQDGGEE
jgi:DNA-binding PadR family transcriptional regulator